MNLLDDNSLEWEKRRKTVYPSRWARFGAAFIDHLIIMIINFILGLFLMRDVPILAYFINSVLYPLYKILMEGDSGQTIGKKFMDIKVVREEDGLTPITIADAGRRFLLWWPVYIGSSFHVLVVQQSIEGSIVATLFALIIIGGYIFCLGSMLRILVAENGQAWHDKIGKTICVRATYLKT